MTPDRTPAWAAWSPQAVLVSQLQPDGSITETAVPAQVHPDWRYLVRLEHLDTGMLLLRTGDSRGTRLHAVSDDPGVAPLVPLPAAVAEFPPSRVLPFPDGTVAGIDPQRSRLLLSAGGRADARSFPPDLLVADLTRDAEGRWWICGGEEQARPSEFATWRAWAASEDDGRTWRRDGPTGGGLLGAWHSVWSGAAAAYRRIFVVNRFLVLAAETEAIDDQSTLIDVRDPRGRWHQIKLRHDVLRTVLPGDGDEVLLFSHHGMMVGVSSRAQWRRDLGPQLLQALRRQTGRPPDDLRVELLGARAGVAGTLLLVSLRIPRAGGLARFGEAIATMTAEGIHLLMRYDDPDRPEPVTVCWGTSETVCF